MKIGCSEVSKRSYPPYFDYLSERYQPLRSMELELLSPLDSDDSIHEYTEIEIATVMDQIALLNPEGKCRA